jgi:hypothetical protein
MTTPPGWYPDPGHTGNGPALERWWDGTQWSEYTRDADRAHAPLFDAPGSAPGYGPGLPDGDVIIDSDAPGRRGKLVVGVLAAVVLVAGVVGGVVVVLTGGGGDAEAGAASPSAAPFDSGGTASGSGGQDGQGGPRHGIPGGPPGAPATADPGYVLDRVDGIQLPVPDGWTGATDQSGLAGLTVGKYACPGGTAQSCVRGGVFSMPAETVELTSTTAQAAAKEDIGKNADDSYGADVYGGITSHQQLESEQVTVAGERGYLVRWKVVTEKGDDGFVQSLVFPAPGDSSRLVLIRYGFDVNGKAPGLGVMDQITKGIKLAPSSGTGV